MGKNSFLHWSLYQEVPAALYGLANWNGKPPGLVLFLGDGCCSKHVRFNIGMKEAKIESWNSFCSNLVSEAQSTCLFARIFRWNWPLPSLSSWLWPAQKKHAPADSRRFIRHVLKQLLLVTRAIKENLISPRARIAATLGPSQFRTDQTMLGSV